jgi:hypothetical protein
MFKTHDMYSTYIDTRIHEGNNEEENNGDVVFQWGNMVVVRGGESVTPPALPSFTAGHIFKDDENVFLSTTDICSMLVSHNLCQHVPYDCSIYEFSCSPQIYIVVEIQLTLVRLLYLVSTYTQRTVFLCAVLIVIPVHLRK